MTEEEVEQALAAKDAELAKLKEEKDKLEKNQSNQNAYISKLEESKNGLSESLKQIQATANKPVLDPNLTAYFKKKYVEEFIQEGKELIKKNDTRNNFELLEPELDEFLSAYMDENNASQKFILDSYSLVLGRAIANPEHAINKVPESEAGKAQEQKPEPMIVPVLPPMMTPADQGGSIPVAKSMISVPDTKAAFKMLEERLYNNNPNKFE